MMDDVTRRFFIREGQKLSIPVYEAVDTACAEAMKDLRFNRFEHPHLHGLYRRAALRDSLKSSDMPGGWRVAGNSRLSEQLILEHPDFTATLRVLSESGVTANGVPHAGSNTARRDAWSIPMTLFGYHDGDRSRRDLLLLCRFDLAEPQLRIVRTTEPGRYKGVVPCDFGLPLLRDGGAAYDDAFAGDSEEVDLFNVAIQDEEHSDSV